MSLNLKDPKSVKDKLENLRKLFEEEDMNEAVKKIQKEWETEERSVDQNMFSHGGGMNQFQGP